MKNKYTRKQIVESIKYWKKQLKEGNYKKVNESTNINIKNPTPKQFYNFLKTCNPNAIIQIYNDNETTELLPGCHLGEGQVDGSNMRMFIGSVYNDEDYDDDYNLNHTVKQLMIDLLDPEYKKYRDTPMYAYNGGITDFNIENVIDDGNIVKILIDPIDENGNDVT